MTLCLSHCNAADQLTNIYHSHGGVLVIILILHHHCGSLVLQEQIKNIHVHLVNLN